MVSGGDFDEITHKSVFLWITNEARKNGTQNAKSGS